MSLPCQAAMRTPWCLVLLGVTMTIRLRTGSGLWRCSGGKPTVKLFVGRRISRRSMIAAVLVLTLRVRPTVAMLQPLLLWLTLRPLILSQGLSRNRRRGPGLAG